MTGHVPATTVAVIGAGAIGGLLTARLVDAGHAVTLCVRTPIDRLILEEGDAAREIAARIVTTPDGLGPVPWVLLTTKSQDTADAAPWLQKLADARTTVVVVQNGVGHVERVAPLAPAATILPALIYAGVERLAAGRIRLHTPGRMAVPAGEAGAAFAALLAGGGIEVRQDPDFATAVWRKVLTNVAANPITALTLSRIGVFNEPDIADLGAKLLAEAVAVARAEGARVDADHVGRTIEMHRSYNPATGTSMLYDRLAGRPMELEYITGAVVRAAEKHGLDVPFNRAILALLRALDKGMREGA